MNMKNLFLIISLTISLTLFSCATKEYKNLDNRIVTKTIKIFPVIGKEYFIITNIPAYSEIKLNKHTLTYSELILSGHFIRYNIIMQNVAKFEIIKQEKL